MTLYVKCVDPIDHLLLGKVYEVLDDFGEYYKIVLDDGVAVVYFKKRFEPVDKEKNVPIVINEKAKPVDLGHDAFWEAPFIKLIASSKQLTTKEKTNILLNLGRAYQNLSPAWKDHFMKATDIDKALVWEETPQGHKYWSNLQHKINWEE